MAEVTDSHTLSQLTAIQLQAVMKLVEGRNVSETAQELQVCRETVSRWKNSDPVFIAELNRQREELWENAQERLRHLVGAAVDTLEDAVIEGDLKAAIEVLKTLKLHGNISPPSEPTDTDAVLRQWARQWAEQEWQRQSDGSPILAVCNVNGEGVARLMQEQLAVLRAEYGLDTVQGG